MERIDLHIHSNCSDGKLSPKQVIEKAFQNGVSIMAFADHDSVKAYQPDVVSFAKEKGIKLIVGAEFSTKFNGVGYHILGYNFDINNKELNETLDCLQNARQNYLLDVSKKLQELNFIVNTNFLQSVPSVTKAHISQNVIENPENSEALKLWFGHIPSKGEFIEAVMNEGCPAYTQKFSITPHQASKIIHNAGGVVVVAHPVAYAHEDKQTAEDILTLAKQINADGIESNYLYVNAKDEFFDECDFWNNLAERNGFVSTVGSDYHTSDGIRPEIGFANYNLILTQNQIDAMFKLLKLKREEDC